MNKKEKINAKDVRKQNNEAMKMNTPENSKKDKDKDSSMVGRIVIRSNRTPRHPTYQNIKSQEKIKRIYQK